MKCMMKTPLFVIAFTCVLSTGPAVEAQVRPSSQVSAMQIIRGITELEAVFGRIARTDGFFEKSKRDQADALLEGGLRLAAFNLQSLGRVYRKYPIASTQGFLKKLRESAKDLEDHLGEYDKMKSLGKAPAMGRAAVALMGLVAREGWLDRAGRSPRATVFKAAAARQAWLSPAEDRDFAIGELVDQLQSVAAADYDMRRLEAGLHELRRELRWFSISARALGGVVIASSVMACPQRQSVFAAHADPKYGLPTSGPFADACRISTCLSVELNGAVTLLGELKDEAEPIVENDPALKRADRTPPQVAARAQNAYSALLRSGILENTQSQLRACLR